jgi:hypothetical protein
MPRFLLGLLVTALWLPAVAFVATPQWRAFGVLVASFTVPLTLLFAAPIAFALRQRTNVLVCAIFGTLGGGIGALIFTWTTNPIAGRNWAPGLVVLGLLCGLVFWFSAVWRNAFFSPNASDQDAT